MVAGTSPMVRALTAVTAAARAAAIGRRRGRGSAVVLRSGCMVLLSRLAGSGHTVPGRFAIGSPWTEVWMARWCGPWVGTATEARARDAGRRSRTHHDRFRTPGLRGLAV